MILKNDVLASKGSLQGIYGVYQTTNGRTSWKSASKAIWYIPDYDDWAIGDLEDIGTKTREIKSNGDQSNRSPSEVPNNKWHYYKNGWKNVDGEIIVKCVNDKGKITHREFWLGNDKSIMYFQILNIMCKNVKKTSRNSKKIFCTLSFFAKSS